MDPKEHDKHIAYVSHLSHISSFMLGKTVMEKEKDEKTIFDMAGSGFESTVRLVERLRVRRLLVIVAPAETPQVNDS